MQKRINDQQNKQLIYTACFLILSTMSLDVFADATQAVDSANALTPMLDKILNSMSGTLGKIIMSIGIVLSGSAAVAGMNKAVILTPIGVGLLLGNAKTIVNWMF